jgi:hypothetical protein
MTTPDETLATCNLCALGRDSIVVHKVRRLAPKTLRRKRLADRALVRAREAVRVRLDDRITGGDERRVARLQGETVHHDVEENGVAALAVGVCACVGIEAEVGDEGGVDVDEHVGPDLTNVCHGMSKPHHMY